MFIHMAEQQSEEIGDPSRFWAYKDEDFVGYVGGMSVARGGKRNALTTPMNVIAKYRGSA